MGGPEVMRAIPDQVMPNGRAEDRIGRELVANVVVGRPVVAAQGEGVVVSEPRRAALVVIIREGLRPRVERLPLERAPGPVLCGHSHAAVERPRGRIPDRDRPQRGDRAVPGVDERDHRRIPGTHDRSGKVEVPVALQVGGIDVVEVNSGDENRGDFVVDARRERDRPRIPVVVGHGNRLCSSERIRSAAGDSLYLLGSEHRDPPQWEFIEVDPCRDELPIDGPLGRRQRDGQVSGRFAEVVDGSESRSSGVAA